MSMATETHPAPTFITGIFVLAGAMFVAMIFGVAYELTGIAGPLALAEVSVVVLFICRETVIGDIL